jgi:hypothetical protein
MNAWFASSQASQRNATIACGGEFMREPQARKGLVMPHLAHSDMAKDGMRGDTVVATLTQAQRLRSRAATQALCPRPGKPASGRSAPRCEGRYGPPALEPRRPMRRTACSRPTSVAGHHATIRAVPGGRRCDGTSPPRHDGHPIRPRFERCPQRTVGMPHCGPGQSLDERTGLRGHCRSPRRRAGRKLSRRRSLVVPEHQYRLRPGGEATLCAGAERGPSMRCGAACSIARASGPA